MKTRVAAGLLVALVPFGIAAPASAAKLPAIRATTSNAVPECATPGRLMAFLRSRNPSLNPRYNEIAVAYMRHGEDLGLRWDISFAQMLVETDSLRYTGDVHPKQNNFAGLGATGGGARGESFKNVSSGVRAHLEHTLMYTGTHVDNPVADRTRKVQSWGILTKWQNRIKGPMTFKHLTAKWSPGDRGYPRDISTIADIFYSRFCNIEDPNPELLAKARGGRNPSTEVAVLKKKTLSLVPDANASTATDAPPVGSTPTISATATGKADAKAGSARSTLGGQPGAGRLSAGGTKVAVLNAPKKDEIAPTKSGDAAQARDKDKAKSKTAAQVKTKPKTKAKTKTKTKTTTAPFGNCKVWTASYGGPKAMIIKAINKGVTNYTVLDVNVGKETREADAYIAAYAKGGKTVGTYPSPAKALKQAFQLCPEG